MPNLTATINVQVEKTSGKFVSKDEIASIIAEVLEAADDGLWVVEDSEYETREWDVTVQ